jgi:ABC-type dipeptide/oligopeptide/nickel transport system permease subunit
MNEGLTLLITISENRNIIQVSVSELPICIFITRGLVTRMTSDAYVYNVDTVESSPYKAMSRQLSVNISI